jgi:hypothetical protein
MQRGFDPLKIAPKRMKVVSFGGRKAQNEALLCGCASSEGGRVQRELVPPR